MRSYSWRWWTGIYAMHRRPPEHRRPHIGRRRSRRVWVACPAWVGYERRSAAGRPLAFQRPPYELELESVISGPYEEHYAGYRATWWYQRRVMRDRERRGWPREKQYRNLYRPHPLQGGKK